MTATIASRRRPAGRRVVAHLVSALNTGGTETQLLELLRVLDRERWCPRLVCFRRAGALLDAFRRLGVEPEELSLGPTLARPAIAAAIARLAWSLRRVDLVHCHDVHAILVGVPAARIARVPVVAARRDLGHHLGAAQRLALRLVLRRATFVLANALTVAARVERDEGVPAARIAVVPNGIDVARFDARAATVASLPPASPGAGPVIVTVARMNHPAKGHDDLLEAAALVTRQAPTATFLVVGDGPRVADVQAHARRLGLGERVRFLGLRRDVPALLARADVACHPARAEGLPNAVIEAMAARLPIVATSVGGVPELVEDGVSARLVPPGEPAAMARALLEILADPGAAASLGAAARARVEGELTIDRLAARTERLYEAAVRRG